MQIAVCDDEKEIRELLAEKVMRLYPDAVLLFYSSGEELLLNDSQPDILLLDIQMPGRNGMVTAGEFRKKHKDTILIFVTALEEYVFQAFDVGAFHYLVKPFGMMEGGKHITVSIEEIVYAEVFNRKIILHTLRGDIEYYGRMKELQKKVGEDFYRPHRAYLINFNYVRKYDAVTIYLEKGQALMAKQNYHEFVQCYLRYNQRKGKKEAE